MELLRVVIFAVITFSMSCGSNSKPNLTGNWTFSAHSAAFNLTYSGSAIIQENNDSLTGTMTLTGSPCATATNLQGSVTNNNITLQEWTPETFTTIATLTGTISQSSLSGNFYSPYAGCPNGDFGTWTATKH